MPDAYNRFRVMPISAFIYSIPSCADRTKHCTDTYIAPTMVKVKLQFLGCRG